MKYKFILKFLIQFLAVIAILFAVYYFSDCSAKQDLDKISNNGATAICTVIDCGRRKGSYVIIKYNVDSVEYKKEVKTFFSSFKYIPIGEKYIIEYYIPNPKICDVQFDKPCFVENEKTQMIMGRIVKITDRNVCMFEYNVGGKTYERFQKITDGKNVNENKDYVVEYLIANPLRSVIRIE